MVRSYPSERVADICVIPQADVPFHYGRGAQSAKQHTWYARDPIGISLS